jgi:hypothetical protein
MPRDGDHKGAIVRAIRDAEAISAAPRGAGSGGAHTASIADSRFDRVTLIPRC